MENTLNVFIDEKEIEGVHCNFTPSHRVHSVVWPLQDACKITDQHMMEHICDIKVPPIFRGKKVALYAVTNHNFGHWKYDWHWEGISVIVKNSDQVPQKVIMLDNNGERKKE